MAAHLAMPRQGALTSVVTRLVTHVGKGMVLRHFAPAGVETAAIYDRPIDSVLLLRNARQSNTKQWPRLLFPIDSVLLLRYARQCNTKVWRRRRWTAFITAIVFPIDSVLILRYARQFNTKEGRRQVARRARCGAAQAACVRSRRASAPPRRTQLPT